MVLVRKYRAWCRLLLAVLALGSGLVVEEAFAKGRPARGANDSNQSVQQLLSDNRTDDVDAATRIFRLGNGAVPILVGALQKRTNVERASLALLYLAGPEERKQVRQFVRTEKDPEKKWVIARFLAGALVEPASADEWAFLESCVKGYKDEAQGFTSFSAVLALGTNASPKALQVLQSVGPSVQESESKNETLEEVGRAIRWINDRSSPKHLPRLTKALIPTRSSERFWRKRFSQRPNLGTCHSKKSRLRKIGRVRWFQWMFAAATKTLTVIK